jgi:hypothetical protein
MQKSFGLPNYATSLIKGTRDYIFCVVKLSKKIKKIPLRESIKINQNLS